MKLAKLLNLLQIYKESINVEYEVRVEGESLVVYAITPINEIEVNKE